MSATSRRFSSGAVRVLVATDIAARGIHVDGIDLVIHADPPAEHKAYLHRSGRTGRAGASGVVVTLQTPAQASDVRALMRKAHVVPLAATVQARGRAAALDSRKTRQIARAAAIRGGCGARNRHGKPGNWARRGRHVRRLPGPAKALTHARQATGQPPASPAAPAPAAFVRHADHLARLIYPGRGWLRPVRFCCSFGDRRAR